MKGPVIRTKRVYLDAEPSDGRRILVDRLWPRGVSKEKARIDHWAKAVAPSRVLREWFAHEPGKWPEFKRRYAEELDTDEASVEALIGQLGSRKVTFLYAARSDDFNNAVALKAYIEARLKRLEG
jgi:uncharacterized protein YeaO (DUF488 family)